MTAHVKALVAFVVIAVLLVLAANALIPRSDTGSGPMLEDENNLRQFAGLCVRMGKLPTRDGLFRNTRVAEGPLTARYFSRISDKSILQYAAR